MEKGLPLRLLRLLWRRLVRGNELFIKYRDKIHKLIALGHVVKTPNWPDCDNNQTWFINLRDWSCKICLLRDMPLNRAAQSNIIQNFSFEQ